MYGVTKDGCKLNWRPPEDDGGLPIKEYLVEKMDKETGKWVAVCRTPPDTTNCPVKGLQEGHEYLFRVKAINDEGESEPLTADKAIKAKDPFGNNKTVGPAPRITKVCGRAHAWRCFSWIACLHGSI